MNTLILFLNFVLGLFTVPITNHALGNCHHQTIHLSYTNSKFTDSTLNYYTIALRSKILDSFKTTILNIDPSVDSIIFNPKTKILTFFVNTNNHFFKLSKTSEFDAIYDQYHDIYSASFVFKKVNGVSIYDNYNKEYLTLVPIKNDALFFVEKNVFYRNIYVRKKDYGTMNLKYKVGKNNQFQIALKDLKKKLM